MIVVSADTDRHYGRGLHARMLLRRVGNHLARQYAWSQKDHSYWELHHVGQEYESTTAEGED